MIFFFFFILVLRFDGHPYYYACKNGLLLIGPHLSFILQIIPDGGRHKEKKIIVITFIFYFFFKSPLSERGKSVLSIRKEKASDKFVCLRNEDNVINIKFESRSIFHQTGRYSQIRDKSGENYHLYCYFTNKPKDIKEVCNFFCKVLGLSFKNGKRISAERALFLYIIGQPNSSYIN